MKRRSIIKKFKKYYRKLLTPLHDAERWIAYRTYEKYHTVNTRLSPGYYDKDVQMLHACFSLLEDFIEIELSSGVWGANPGDKIGWKQYLLREISWPWPINYLKPPFRSRKLGLEYLEFISLEVNSVDKDRAAWLQIKDLYLWWKDKRPNRKDHNEVSGLNRYWDEINNKYNGEIHYFEPTSSGLAFEMKIKLTEEEDKKLGELSVAAGLLAEAYDKEDQEMLQKLVEVRRFMWF